MLKTLLGILAILIVCVASAGTTTQVLQYDSSAPIPNGYTLSGSGGGYAGIRDNRDGTYPYFGSASFSWSRTNTDGYTHTGYEVVVSVANPTYPNVANFPLTGSVVWLDAVAGGPVDPIGGGSGD